MLKHSDIIGALEPLQKTALVSSPLEDEALTQAGLPAAGKASLSELGKKRGVSYPCAARTWNLELVGKMTEELVSEAGGAGARLFVSPDLKAAIDPYKEALSEDAFFSGEMGAAIVGATHAAGGAIGLSRLSLDGEDLSYLDRRENPGTVHERVSAPFLRAVKEEPCEAIFLTPERGKAGYANTNRALFSDSVSGYFGNVFTVAEEVAPTADSLTLLRGKVALGGATLPLERAVMRYRQLKGYLDEGSINERDLEDAVREGGALEESKLDEAADEIADFALRLAEHTPAGDMGEEARQRVAEECIVLLKNRGVLPLATGTRIAIVGDAYSDLTPFGARFTVAGRARGYEPATDRSDTYLPEAVRAAGEAEVVLVFLTLGETGKSLAMPANRLALLDALKNTGRKVVALVAGDLPADMSFDSDLDATLAVPADGPYAAEALARVLMGETDAAGRLTRTAFDGADGYFRVWKANKDAGRMRVGGFLGYLRYDTAGESVRYPFGYGLSYTTFSYSGISLDANKVSFTVKNTGKRAGCEVAQVYIGAPSVSHVSPKKRLAGFAKVYLAPGESKRVTVPLPLSSYATFDPRTLSDNVEKGVYRVYVCSSALDIKLWAKRNLAGVEREKTEETPAEFFPGGDFSSAKNVRREHRLGNAYTGKVPQKLKTARKAALFALPALAYLFFFLVTMLVFSYTLDYTLFFYIDDPAVVEWLLYILAVAVIGILPLLFTFNRKRLVRWKAAALVVCPILMFVCFVLGFILIAKDGGYAERLALRIISCFAVGAPLAAIVAAIVDRALRKYDGGVNSWAKYYLEREPEAFVTPETEFEEAFRLASVSVRTEKRKKPEEEEPLPLPDVPQFYDRHLDFATMLRDCRLFAQERGLVVGESALRAWLAALVSAQLILVPAGDGAALCSMVAEYFGRGAFIDNGESYARGEDLFTHWRQSERIYVQTEFSAALAAAKRESAFLHTVLIRHADPVRVMQALAPVAEVFARKKTAIVMPDGTQVILPPNLRLVVEIEKDRVERLPAGIAEVAAVLSPKCKDGEVAAKKTILQTVGFERFSALRQTVRDEYPLGEQAWKNVDALDARCRTGHIGNLLWVRTELHASVAAACGAGETEALDEAIACELFPWLSETWNEEECGGTLDDALLGIFGTDGIRLTEEALKEKKGGEDE